MINGRIVNCNKAFKENKRKQESPCDKRKVFVGGLHNDVNNKELQEFFEIILGGKVENAYVVKNEVQNKSKGFGYVEFLDEQSKNEILKQYSLNQ